MITKIIIASLLISSLAFAKRKDRPIKMLGEDKYSYLKEKNGISLDLVTKNFTKNFEFVSVHWREDKSELRFIYGNKLAMEGLKSKDYKYKDGAIFYKIAYSTKHDPLFNASLVPDSQPQVRQIMLRDNKRFKSTNGWGYAVFTRNGDSLPGDPDATLATCFACHKLASARSDVFSNKIETIIPNENVADNSIDLESVSKAADLSKLLFKFTQVDFSSLDSEIQATISQKTSKVNNLIGEINTKDFPGYMSELNSYLIKETIRTKLPSVVYRKFNDRLLFSFSFVDEVNKECPAGQRGIRYGLGSKGDFASKNVFKISKKCFKF